MTTICLPWPPKGCHPNRNTSMHWAVKGKARKDYHQQCAWIAKTVKYSPPEGDIPVKIMFHPPNGGDIDNMLAAIKGGVDGICEIWGIDDKRLRPMTLDVGESVKDGKVVITF